LRSRFAISELLWHSVEDVLGLLNSLENITDILKLEVSNDSYSIRNDTAACCEAMLKTGKVVILEESSK